MVKRKKKTKGKRFLPVFRPLYVNVIAVDKDKVFHKMQMIMPIQFDGSSMTVFVVKP